MNTRHGPVTINGVTRSVIEWAKISGMHEATIYRRLERGVTGPDLLAKNLRRNVEVCECGQPASVKDGSGWQCERCKRLNSEVFRWHDLAIKAEDVRRRHEAMENMERAA